MKRDFRLWFAVAVAAWAGAAQAQTGEAPYPTRPVRVIVPYPPGGTADATPRIIAEKLSLRWGQPVVIDNRPGAGGNIGAELLAKADPDGYTLMGASIGPVVVNRFLYSRLSYDQTRFTPITLLSTTVSVLAVPASSPFRSTQELIAAARSQPRKLNYASQGSGSTSHLTTAMFEKAAGIQMVHIPFKGSAPALAELIAGRVDLFFDNVSSSLASHRGGRIRILATAGEKRSPYLPEVPTLAEAGLPGFLSISWNIVVGPDRLPASLTQSISQAILEALKLPDVQKRYQDFGSDIAALSPAQTANFLVEEAARWSKVIQDSGIKAD